MSDGQKALLAEANRRVQVFNPENLSKQEFEQQIGSIAEVLLPLKSALTQQKDLVYGADPGDALERLSVQYEHFSEPDNLAKSVQRVVKKALQQVDLSRITDEDLKQSIELAKH